MVYDDWVGKLDGSEGSTLGTFDGIITCAYAADDTKLYEKIKSTLLGIVDGIELGNKVGIVGNTLFGSIKGDLEGFRDCINDGNELGRCE